MKYFGWIFLFFIVMFIIPLASRPMISPAEFAGALPAREMVESSSYAVVPGDPATPPMPSWAMAASYNLFGINTFAARLPSALAAGITALFIALLIRQHLRDEKLAALAATIYISFSAVFFYAGIPLPYIFAAMMMAGSLGTMFLAVQEIKFNRRMFLLSVISGLFSALALLSCGITALITPIIMAVYLVFNRKLKELLMTLLPWLICAVLPILPWAAILLLCPNMDKFLSTGDLSIPWFVYLFFIIIGLFPVWVLIPAALMTGRESWKRLWSQPLTKFACAAVAVPLIAAIALRTLAPAFLLLCFPALAILIARGLQAYFNTGGHHRSFDWMLNLWATILVLSGLAEVILWYMPGIYNGCSTILPFKPVVLLVFGVTSLLGGGALLYSLRGNWRSRLYLFFFSVAILPLGFSWCFKSTPFMPEKEFNYLIADYDIIPEKSAFFTREEYIPALQWCTGSEVQDVTSMQPDSPVEKPAYIILKKDDPLWQKFPGKKESGILRGDFIAAEFLPAKSN